MKIAVQIGYKEREFLCSCGYHHITQFKGNFECPSCGIDKVLKLDRHYKTKQVSSDYYIIEKGLKFFHIAKDKYRIVFHKDNTMTVKHIDKEEFKYSLITKEATHIKYGEEYKADYMSIERMFSEMSFESIFNLITVPENRELYKFAHEYLSNKEYREWERKIGKALERLLKYGYIELLYFCGFTSKSLLQDICRTSLNIDETKPHTMLGVPKIFIKYIIEMNSFNIYIRKAMIDLYDSIGGNNFKTVFSILIEETELKKVSVNNFCIYISNLYKSGYKNLERLTLYACRDLKLNQGIGNPADGLNYLNDYIKMMKEMNYEYEKYPKSLKKEHDIASMNYRILQDKEQIRLFSEKIVSEDYLGLTMKSKDYSVITPKESDDLIKEGESLSHCVASYVKDVTRGLCKILFLRKTDNLDESCVTIEVRGKSVRQVRGRQNRLAIEDEKIFIQKWAVKKGLTVTCKFGS